MDGYELRILANAYLGTLNNNNNLSESGLGLRMIPFSEAGYLGTVKGFGWCVRIRDYWAILQYHPKPLRIPGGVKSLYGKICFSRIIIIIIIIIIICIKL